MNCRSTVMPHAEASGRIICSRKRPVFRADGGIIKTAI